MKSYLMVVFMMLPFPAICISCGTDDPVPETEQSVSVDNSDDGNTSDDQGGDKDDDNSMSNNLKITVGSTSFGIRLEDNITATVFKALLPMTVNMSEMNGNEKYYYLTGSLPVASSNPGTIRTGDLMLYGSSCVVLFYETFRTSYSYTRLGRMDNPSGLVSALGSGSVTVTFELE